jgi:hypothetical protein
LHGCKYCYARDIANRFYKEKFTPTFHVHRLKAPANTPVPQSQDIGSKNVFVCFQHVRNVSNIRKYIFANHFLHCRTKAAATARRKRGTAAAAATKQNGDNGGNDSGERRRRRGRRAADR